ncbi:unnamed protein product [Caenorhabditis brenneri]
MKTIHWFLLSLITCVNGQDKSFESFCKFYGGKYQARNGIKDIRGDRCELALQPERNVEYDPHEHHHHFDQQAPYHVHGANYLTSKTICNIGVTLICPDGWIQYFGRCYFMEKRMMLFDEAEKFCAAKKATLPMIHREILIRYWYEYFTNVHQIWARSTEPTVSDLIYDKGPHLMIAFDGYPYNLPPKSLLKVDGSIVKAMVLCESTPPITMAHLDYLRKRYFEIYYPSIMTEEGLFIRTTSKRVFNQDPKVDDDYCRGVVKAFMPLIGITVKSAKITADFLRNLGEIHRKEKIPEGFYRTSVHYSGGEKERKQSKCQVDDNPIKRFNVDPGLWNDQQPEVVCDAATYSSAIRLSEYEQDPKLEVFSDARLAPIYCQITVD